MNESLKYKLDHYWKPKYKKVYFNNDVEYWGYSRTKWIPFSALMMDYMEKSFRPVDIMLIVSIVNSVSWTKDYLVSGGRFIQYSDFKNVCGRNNYYLGMKLFKKYGILMDFGDNYYVFNEKFIYKIRNESVKLKK